MLDYNCVFCGSPTHIHPSDQEPPQNYCNHDSDRDEAVEELLDDYCDELGSRIRVSVGYANMYNHGTSHADERTRDYHLNQARKYTQRLSYIHDWLNF